VYTCHTVALTHASHEFVHTELVGLNGIEFGDSRELYIQLGGNTNGGVPGRISGSSIQKENYYSSATLVAYIHKSGFNGTLTYNADDDGNPSGGSGIEFFCVGNRNPFGLTLHSNGYLYGTDNGPNTGYGECAFHYLAHYRFQDYLAVNVIWYIFNSFSYSRNRCYDDRLRRRND
jgi:hypothetical protein